MPSFSEHPILQTREHQIYKPRMRCILLVDVNGLVVAILRNSLRLLEIVGRNIDTVTCLKSGGNHTSLLGPWKDLVPDVKEVNRNRHLIDALVNTSVNLLSENGRYHSKFLRTFEHADVAFMNLILRLSLEIFPLGVEGLALLQQH